MYPKHIAQGLSPEEAQQPGKLIGSGPWKLKEFKPNISIEYVRNPNYFKRAAVLRRHALYYRPGP